MSAVQKKAVYKSVYVKCAEPVDAGIFDFEGFTEYVQAKFKPFKGGDAGAVGITSPDFDAEKNALAKGKTVIIGTNKEANALKISTKSDVSKRYIKFVVKKFLKKNSLRDHIRVVADKKNSFSLKFFMHGDDEAAAEAIDE